jgi:hypothetical protein
MRPELVSSAGFQVMLPGGPVGGMLIDDQAPL